MSAWTVFRTSQNQQILKLANSQISHSSDCTPIGLARCHADIRVTRANLYMDSVFLNKMPHAVGSAGLEPTDFSPMSVAVSPPNFGSRHSLMPGSTWNFKSLTVRGLSTGVGRSVSSLNHHELARSRLTGTFFLNENAPLQGLKIVLRRQYGMGTSP